MFITFIPILGLFSVLKDELLTFTNCRHWGKKNTEKHISAVRETSQLFLPRVQSADKQLSQFAAHFN